MKYTEHDFDYWTSEYYREQPTRKQPADYQPLLDWQLIYDWAVQQPACGDDENPRCGPCWSRLADMHG